MSANWTKSQRNAIWARGGTLLVSAAAGSGKTAVLVQRVIERITDTENPVDADRLLIVTFTKAAAAEMSGRIESSVSKMLETDPFNTRLQRQQILLSRAHISTIDSFCADLVRENFYRLGIPADFRILDESEMAVLRSDAAAAVLEEAYEKGDAAFLNFAELFSTGRDDAKIIRTVEQLYDFVRSHPFPNRWLAQKSALYDPSVPVGESLWGQAVLDYAAETIRYCTASVTNSIGLIEDDDAMLSAYGDSYRSDLLALQVIENAVREKNWDRAASLCSAFAPARLKSLRGRKDDPLKARVSAARKDVSDAVENLSKLFCASQAQCSEDIARLSPAVATLFDVTRRFSERLDAMKAERRAADFGDLEHWALSLLVRETETGCERTPQAEELAEGFDEVMVDEYQDTNETQDMIFRAVSRNEKNLFMVGDVKQSIYRFRQAMPQIFLSRRRQFAEYDESGARFPACVTLGKNFRSRPGVADAVNFVFRQLMSRQAGEMDYTQAEELVPAREAAPDGEPASELHLIDLSSAEEETEALHEECRLIAGRIYELTADGRLVEDHGNMRPALYRDFCVLLRSANKSAHEYARELTALGIPSWADTAGGFFASREIGTALSLLRVVDNPLQDIPLLAVMMSPIYGFTPDDVSEIRIAGRAGRLYPAVSAAAKAGNIRAADFLEEMDGFRVLAATMPSDRLIRSIFEKTGFPEIARAMPSGELRLANLRLLLEYAAKFESSGYNGLSGFLRFLDRLQKNGSDLSAASAVSESANVVRIMSIHHSKGLEFPFCVLAGCGHAFHRETSDVVLHPELGFGVRLKDAETGCRYTTLPREAVALAQKRDGMSEELRVLYVAMTRAREKLILVASVKNAGKTLAKLASRITGGRTLPPYVVQNSSSIAEWLLLCALRHPDGASLRRIAGAGDDIVLPASGRCEVRVVVPSAETVPQESAEEIPAAVPDEELLARLEENLDYAYPYADLKGVCAKVAASELAERKTAARYAAVSRPAFLEGSGLTPAERGTALHAFLQFADFRLASADPQAERERLTANGFLTKEQADSIDLAQVRTFYHSNIAKRIMSAENAEREFRFTVEIPAQRAKPELAEALRTVPVVLQGAVDCAFRENDKIVIVDYKTDRIKDEESLWERYREQLALYRSALESCTGLKVSQCVLYSFFLGREVCGPEI